MSDDRVVDAAWDDLEAWWGAHMGPEFMRYLNPGASDEALDALESLVGAPLPRDFRLAYARHDGQESFYEADGDDKLLPGLFFGLPMLPVHDVAEELRNWREFITEAEEDYPPEALNEHQRSYPEGHVKPVYAHPMWIPFADDSGGNFLGIDLAPDDDGTVGQVIVFGREEHTKYVLAPSFRAYLRQVADELKRGNFVLEEEAPGEWSLNIGHPEGTTHYFDAVRELFGEEA